MIEDYQVIETMRRFGGGFVQALAEAASRADSDNLERIKRAFPEYWEEYSAMSLIKTNPYGTRVE